MSSSEVLAKESPMTQLLSMEDSENPVWLTPIYMEKVLRSYFKETNLKVLRIEMRPALGKGENYCGVLTRLKVEFCRRSGSTEKGFYMVKSSFEGDAFALSLIEPYDVFNRELFIYENVLPKLKALLKEIPDDEEIFAETIAIDHEHKAIIFEDLNAKDFHMPDRLEGLDEEVATIALRKLAKMHATSVVLNAREPGSLEGFDKGMFNNHTDNYAPLFVGLLEACIRRISQWEDTKFSFYAEKLRALRPVFMNLAKRVFEALPGDLNVLAHGDLWTNNLLVKYDPKTGKSLDVLLIDFQYAAWGSPAIDLFYFLNTSLKEDLHFNRQNELIKEYYEVLAETLVKLSFKGYLPSLHRFLIQLTAKEFYAFHSSCLVAAVHLNQFTEEADFHALMETNERAIRFKDICFQNDYVQRILKHFLPIYERRGLLEVDQ